MYSQAAPQSAGYHALPRMGSTKMFCAARLLSATREPQSWQINMCLPAIFWMIADSQKPISRSRWHKSAFPFNSATRPGIPAGSSVRASRFWWIFFEEDDMSGNKSKVN
jgi:hypothetical protein